MAKFPQSPGSGALSTIKPATITLKAGVRLARIYYSRSRHPQSWNKFRQFGPLDSRWDHLVPDAAGSPLNQKRAIYYAARDAKTCLAEFFQNSRLIDRAFQSPWLVVFELRTQLTLLDLTGDFPTRMGASMAIHSGSRIRARRWARDLYEAYPRLDGIAYASSMNGGALAFALNDRAEEKGVFPEHPLLHRALADDVLLDSLKDAGERLGYALR